MSVHPSLRTGRSKKHRSVLKRLARILHLQKEDRWTGEGSAFGLPKVKVIKLKIKKEKVKAAEGEEAAAAAEAVAPQAEGAEGKPEVKAEGKEGPGKKPGEKKGKEK